MLDARTIFFRFFFWGGHLPSAPPSPTPMQTSDKLKVQCTAACDVMQVLVDEERKKAGLGHGRDITSGRVSRQL